MQPNTALKLARMEAGFTREALANALGVSTMTVYRWECGDNTPSLYVRQRLSKLLQLPEQAFGTPEKKKEEACPKERFPFLIDPHLFAQREPLIGQRSVLKEIELAPAHMIGLTGLPGSGKTALAQALISQPAFQEFDGIFWATIGQQHQPLRTLQRWLMLLGEKALPESVEEAQDRLRVLLRKRKVLVILDDVWKAEDILPYHMAHSRSILTTRLPLVANTLCDRIYRPRPLSETQAFHLLTRHIPSSLAREHGEVLHALMQQVGMLPLAIEHIGKYLRCEVRSCSRRRLQEAMARLFHAETFLHLSVSPESGSLATLIERSERWLSPSAQRILPILAASFAAAPSSFSEQQVMELLKATQGVQLQDFDSLIDGGLISSIAGDRYQLHPLIAAYARTSKGSTYTG